MKTAETYAKVILKKKQRSNHKFKIIFIHYTDEDRLGGARHGGRVHLFKEAINGVGAAVGLVFFQFNHGVDHLNCDWGTPSDSCIIGRFRIGVQPHPYKIIR